MTRDGSSLRSLYAILCRSCLVCYAIARVLVCCTVPYVLSLRSLCAILVCAILTVCLHSHDNIHPSIHPSACLCVYVSICCTTLTAACPVAACAGAHGRAAPPHAFDNGRAPQHARARVRDPTDGNRLRTLRATRLQKACFPPKWSVRGGGSIMRSTPRQPSKTLPAVPAKTKGDPSVLSEDMTRLETSAS